MEIARFVKLPKGYELDHYHDNYGRGYYFMVMKAGEVIEQKLFDHNNNEPLGVSIIEIKKWIDGVINPNKRMFSHIKF